MPMLVWGGAALCVAGLAGIVWSAVMVARARRTATDEADLKARVAAMLPVNMGALFVAVLGLMAVIVGISLG